MRLFLEGHGERYALEQLQMSLFPDEPMEYCESPFDGDGAVSILRRTGDTLEGTARIRWKGRETTGACDMPVSEETVPSRRRLLQRSYYMAAVQLLENVPSWGALAGVRPTKLTTRALLAGKSETECDELLREVYFVSPERRRLCLDASRAAVEAAGLLSPAGFSLYVGIPFCPSRCAYCSFVSQSAEREGKLIEPFLAALLREIEETGRLLAGTPFQAQTVYIGGGTPTTLSALQLERLLNAISRHFDLRRVLEYTVEAGRPDTLDAEKLAVMKRGGVTRISVNPQTMRDDVLERIGRRHSAADTRRAYALAREAGFDDINMDLIAGLPGDSAAGFADSLAQCVELAPSNLTVHTLARKRGSELNLDRRGFVTAAEVEQMLRAGETTLRGAGYEPYYLYRQKYMSGGFENVGWRKPGRTGLYNIYMMEELHSVLALGGGGMSKLLQADGKLFRQHNPKFPREYLSQLEHVMEDRRVFIERMKTQIGG